MKSVTEDQKSGFYVDTDENGDLRIRGDTIRVKTIEKNLDLLKDLKKLFDVGSEHGEGQIYREFVSHSVLLKRVLRLHLSIVTILEKTLPLTVTQVIFHLTLPCQSIDLMY